MAASRVQPSQSNATRGWQFDPQHAADLIMGVTGEEFPFERAVYTYLLLVWCSIPKHQKTIRATASAVALRVTFSSVAVIGPVRGSIDQATPRLRGPALKQLALCQRRFKEDWFASFYSGFVHPIGGLRQATGAASFGSYDNARCEFFKTSRRELAIIEFLAKALGFNPELASRANCTVAFEHDLLCHGDNFYRPIGKKQKANKADPARAAQVHRGLKKAAFDKLWDKSPKSLVAIYALREILSGEVQKFFSDPNIIARLDEDETLRRKMQACLKRYEAIMTGLEGSTRRTSNFERWRFMRIAEPASKASLPKFTDAQLEKVRSQFPEMKKTTAKPVRR